MQNNSRNEIDIERLIILLATIVFSAVFFTMLAVLK